MNSSHTNDEKFIRRTIELAVQAKGNGDHPFGALLVVDGNVRAEAINQVVSRDDATRHAELSLVSTSCRSFSAEELASSTLYTSTEPCAMCSGAIYWSGIRRVVFGCPEVRLGHFAGTDFLVPCREIFARGKHHVQVVGPVLEDEAVQVHRGFWSVL